MTSTHFRAQAGICLLCTSILLTAGVGTALAGTQDGVLVARTGPELPATAPAVSERGDLIFTMAFFQPDPELWYFQTFQTGARAPLSVSARVLMESRDALPGYPDDAEMSFPNFSVAGIEGVSENYHNWATFNSQGDAALLDLMRWRSTPNGFTDLQGRIRTVTDGAVRDMARTRIQEAPGYPGGFSRFMYEQQRLDSGGTIFFSNIWIPDEGLSLTGLWHDDGASYRPAFMSNEPAPGTDTDFLELAAFDEFHYNREGNFIVRGNLERQPGDHRDLTTGVWGGHISDPGLIARGGDMAPGPAASTYRDFFDAAVHGDTFSFVARLRRSAGVVENENDTGIWAAQAGDSSRSGGVREILREGAPIANIPGLHVADITRAVVLADDYFVFESAIHPGSADAPAVTERDNEALFVHRDGETDALLREGHTVSARAILEFGPIGINAAGDLAFTVDLEGPRIDGSDGNILEGALYAYSRANDELMLIAAAGQVMDFEGQLLTVEKVLFSTKSGLNNNGLIAYTLRFDDGSPAVFTQFVPAPGAIALFGIAALGRRRRR